MLLKSVKENVLADYLTHEIVLSFLFEMGFEIKDSNNSNNNNVVILEREDDEEFSLLGVICDKKNKNYRAQLFSVLNTVADILDVDVTYLVSNVLASYSKKVIEVKGRIEKMINREDFNDGYVLLRNSDEDNSIVKLWLPEEEYSKARTCFSCNGYFVAKLGNGSLFTLSYLNFVPKNQLLIDTSFIIARA